MNQYSKISIITTLIVVMLISVSGIIHSNTIVWDGSVGNWNNSSNWIGGVVPSSSDNVEINSGQVTIVFSDILTIEFIEIALNASLLIDSLGSLTVDDYAAFGIKNKGTIVNEGTITLDYFFTDGILNLNSGAIFENKGIINIKTNNHHAINNVSGAYFHNFPDGTINFVGTNNIDFGIRNAELNSIFDNEGEIYLSVDQITNENDAVFNNLLGGLISLDKIYNSSNFINHGDLVMTGNTILNYGLFENKLNGSISIDNNYSYIDNNSSDAIFINEGSIVINYAITGILNRYGGEFYNYTTGTIDISNMAGVAIKNKNPGSLFANNGILNLHGNIIGIFNAFGGQLNNEGEVNITQATKYGIQNYYSSSSILNSGMINIENSGIYGLYSEGMTTFNNDTIGHLNIIHSSDCGIYLRIYSTFVNDGVLNIVKANVNHGIYNFGSITNNITGSISIDSIAKRGIYNRNYFENNGAISIALSSEGIYNEENGSIFINENNITITGATTLGVKNEESYANDPPLIKGSGTVVSNLDFINKGLLSPGLDIGVMVFEGDFINEEFIYNSSYPIYSILFEIAGGMGGGAIVGHDSIYIDGNLSIGGRLSIVTINGYIPIPMKDIVIMEYTGNLTGSFNNIDLPSPEFDGWFVDFGIDTPGKIIIKDGNPPPCGLNVWTGDIDNSWSNDMNWSYNRVPNICDTVAIENSINSPIVGSDDTITVAKILNSGILIINGFISIE